MTRSTRISPRFFDAQWRLYRSPWMALARELIQNAVDGDGKTGAKRIDISVKHEADHTVLTFSDDGPGMSVETLEGVYYVLGETTKNDDGTIGGFGLARIITCFAHKSYTLYTRDALVVGTGGDWQIWKLPESQFYKGVKLEIQLDRPGHERVLDAFQEYLGLCQLKCDVYVDGKLWDVWTYRNRFAKDLTFGKLYTNKSADPRLLVRVNGTLMFTRYTSANAQVVLEINQERSREVLQASRDGLVGKFEDELDAFVAHLAVDKFSALKAKRNKSSAFRGSGVFKTKRKPKSQNAAQEEAQKWSQYGEEQGYEAGGKMPHPSAHPFVGFLQPKEHTDYFGLNLFDVIISDDTDNPVVRKVIDQYDPRNWDLGADAIRSNVNGEYRRGIGRLKLLLCWKAACDKVVEILQEVRPDAPDEIQWGVGWVFSDSGGASHKQMGDTEYLLLNPCDDKGKMRFSLSDKADLCKLISSAVHEVCHIVFSWHDEEYANCQTDLMDVVLDRKQEILNHMKAVKESALAHLEKV